MANRRPGLDEQPLQLEGLEVDLAAERPMGTTHDFGGGSGRSMLWLGAGAAGLLAVVIGTSVLLGDEPPMSPARPVLASGMATEVADALGRFGAQRLNARLEAMPEPSMLAVRPTTPATAVPVEPVPTMAAPATPAPATPTAPAVAEPTPTGDVEPSEPVPAAAPPASDATPFSGLPRIADEQPEQPEQPERDPQPSDAQPDEAEPAEDADPPAADAPVEDHTSADVSADEARPV